ncbi:unnamed protein product, partial [Tetraodon nigroviridis]
EQDRLRQRLLEEDTEAWQRDRNFSGLERVAGVDLSYIKGDHVNACAQLVVLSYPQLEVRTPEPRPPSPAGCVAMETVLVQVVYEDSQMVALTAPYLAGFLAFRESSALLERLQRLEHNQPHLLPQVVFVDGNGLLHHREFGLACHLGVLSGLPCVGVAKNLLQVQGVHKGEEHRAQVVGLHTH